MQLSIIIVNHNTFELTSACIQSILTSTEDLEYEIILVDNASEECKPDRFITHFPQVQLIINPVNIGFAGGNNSALPFAKGEIILLLNSDTLLGANALKIAYDALVNDSKTGVVSAQLIHPDGRVQHCCQSFPSIKLELLEILRLQKIMPKSAVVRLFQGAFFDHQTPSRPDWVWGTFFMFRSSILDHFSNKKLPADFFLYGEDMQWCYEIRQRTGFDICYVPQAKVVHYLSASTVQTLNLSKTQLMLDHEYIFIKKYYGIFQARLIFGLRAFKYWTLSLHSPAYKSYFLLYYNFTWQH